ncbi:RelA/SpoT family protein [Persephonella sp.]
MAEIAAAELVEDLVKKIDYLDEEDIQKIKEAAYYIIDKHEGQFRKSGEPYYIHPIEAAKILAELKLDRTTIIAGLLHDVVEDTDTSIDEIREKFGDTVALIVDGVTKIGKYNFNSKEEAEAENFRKMLVSMAKDIRVILVKLADRLHNIRTLDPLPEYKQKRIAKETLDIYAPLAARLGLWKIKAELEDTSFKYLYPEAYKKITTYLAESRTVQEKYLQEIITQIRELLDKHNIKADIQYRAKHLYSIYEKTLRKDLSLSDIYDVYGVRVLVNTEKECYLTLGLIHSLWPPIPGRFKDYISLPKSNMYQALHTTVVAPKGKFVEIQIKTYKMHKIAEEGIAAHWRYKGGKYISEKDLKSFTWLRNILDSIKENKDTEIISTVKGDLSNEEVYVFTPKGDLVKLPFGSTPVDFAYHIHTQVGHRTAGAKVNGKMVPLDTKLKNGDVVEIITAKYHKPSRDWLKFVVSSKAKASIKQYFSKIDRRRAIKFGEKLLDKFLKKINKKTSTLDETDINKLLERFSFKTFDDLLHAVGDGKLSPQKVVRFLKGDIEKTKSSSSTETVKDKDLIVEVDGISNIMSTIAKCCCPIPGDEITGVILRGKGISIHAKNCPNAVKVQETEPERIIVAKWSSGDLKPIFPSYIRIISEDRPGLLAEMSSAVASTKTNISGANVKTRRDGKAVTELKVNVKDIDHLNKIISLIKKVKGVEKVDRICVKR